MPTYTIQTVHGVTPKPDGGYGPMQEIELDLHDGSQTFRGVKWFTAAKNTAVPGSTVEGDITEDPKWGLKFKKAKPAGGFNGGGFKSSGGMSPEREKKIVRQHSQEMALRFLALGVVDTTEMTTTVAKELVTQITDFFDKDVFAQDGPVQTLEQAVASLPVGGSVTVTVPFEERETEKIPF